MSGPTGIQGHRGFKGLRGPDGIKGWGYGTSTGPTGGIGKSVVSVVNGLDTIVLSASNSGTLFRFNSLPDSIYQYQTLILDITGLTGQPSGLFWIFNNSSLYGLALYVTGNIFVSSTPIDDSITLVWNGTSIVTI